MEPTKVNSIVTFTTLNRAYYQEVTLVIFRTKIFRSTFDSHEELR
jgi:hypothetical protein